MVGFWEDKWVSDNAGTFFCALNVYIYIYYSMRKRSERVWSDGDNDQYLRASQSSTSYFIRHVRVPMTDPPPSPPTHESRRKKG